jgi:hypothetical protein
MESLTSLSRSNSICLIWCHSSCWHCFFNQCMPTKIPPYRLIYATLLRATRTPSHAVWFRTPSFLNALLATLRVCSATIYTHSCKLSPCHVAMMSQLSEIWEYIDCEHCQNLLASMSSHHFKAFSSHHMILIQCSHKIWPCVHARLTFGACELRYVSVICRLSPGSIISTRQHYWSDADKTSNASIAVCPRHWSNFLAV